MSLGRQSGRSSRTRGLRNSNSSTWKKSWRSTSHQQVDAERGIPCTIDASGPANRLVPPPGSRPSTSRYQRWLRRRSLTLSAIWERRKAVEPRLFPQPGGFESLAGFLIEANPGDAAAAKLEDQGAPCDGFDAIPPS